MTADKTDNSTVFDVLVNSLIRSHSNSAFGEYHAVDNTLHIFVQSSTDDGKTSSLCVAYLRNSTDYEGAKKFSITPKRHFLEYMGKSRNFKKKRERSVKSTKPTRMKASSTES